MTAYVSKCGSDMQFISIFHLMALIPPAAMKDLWLEWLDVMVLSGKPPMQLAFNFIYFCLAMGQE